ISRLMTSINSVIETIPGIGPITGATILGEIGDIHKFSNPKKLVAYAGIDASVSQSGQFFSSSVCLICFSKKLSCSIIERSWKVNASCANRTPKEFEATFF
ncbi:IS110 family transposase, partial [Oceanobacillus profundus]|uniref:IS110 family transposase n=1 Tax=Oceanobacillus profundus TaxID=372463 RepID=UPI0020401410